MKKAELKLEMKTIMKMNKKSKKKKLKTQKIRKMRKMIKNKKLHLKRQ